MTLVWMHSNGLYSAAGTCFSAAAWMTISTPRMARSSRVAVAHVADEEAHARILSRREALCSISYCLSSSREKTISLLGL